MAAARIGVLLLASAVFGVQALKPRCHIKGWGGDFDGKYTFAKEYRESVALKNAKGMKFYLAGEYDYETFLSSYWVLSDSWGATQEDSNFWSSTYLGVYADMMGPSFTTWANGQGGNSVDAKIKCTLHSSLKKVNMLESSPTAIKAWAFMHDNGLETDDDDSDGTKCKSKSTWKKQKCINKCDDASKCANKCKKKCKKCECNEKRLRLV